MEIINIGDSIPSETKIWRYFKFNRFIELLENRNIYFAAATQFEDPFEGVVSIIPYEQSYVESSYNNAFKELCRLTKISCWHIEEYESDAMWKIYADLGKGIAISTTIEKILSSMKPFTLPKALAPENLIFGKISYVNLVGNKLNVDLKKRFFYKHIIFNWEKEFRLAISLQMAEEFGMSIPEKGIYVEIDLHKLIDEIYIGPTLGENDLKYCINICKELGFEEKIKISDLLGKPVYWT